MVTYLDIARGVTDALTVFEKSVTTPFEELEVTAEKNTANSFSESKINLAKIGFISGKIGFLRLFEES